MAAYVFMCIVEITDLAVYDQFSRRARTAIEQYGGRILVAGGKTDIINGKCDPIFPILVEFESRQQAHQWHQSDEFRPLKDLGEAGMKINGVIIDGMVKEFSGLHLIE